MLGEDPTATDENGHPKNWILDACCGVGSTSMAALRSGMNVIAFDNDPYMVSSASMIAALRGMYSMALSFRRSASLSRLACSGRAMGTVGQRARGPYTAGGTLRGGRTSDAPLHLPPAQLAHMVRRHWVHCMRIRRNMGMCAWHSTH